MGKLDQKKLKTAKNKEYADKYRKFNSKEEKKAARKERIKERELRWALQYFGHPIVRGDNE